MLLLLGIITFFGCGPYRGGMKSSPALEEKENLVYLDYRLVQAVPVEALKAERLPSGRLRVHAKFYNKRDHSIECQIKVKFVDGSRQALDETNWMPIVFARHETVEFEHTSLAVGAQDFTVLLRMAE